MSTVSNEIEATEDPGTAPHVLRAADLNPRSEKRAERLRRTARRFGPFALQAVARFRVIQRLADFGIQPFDDRRGRAGGRE